PTRFTLHERMLGRLTIDHQSFDASALIDFSPAEAGALRRLPRVIAFSRVEITLTDRSDPARRWQLSCSGSAEVLVRVHSSGFGRMMRALQLAMRRLERFSPLGDGIGRFSGRRALLAL